MRGIFHFGVTSYCHFKMAPQNFFLDQFLHEIPTVESKP
jgi:hypothetical protein